MTFTIPKKSLRIVRLPHYRGELPAYQTALASGFDVRAQLEGGSMTLSPGQRTLVPTGLSMEIPPGFEVQARPRSGLAIKQGLTLLNTPGTIDADYRGEVKIILVNLGTETVEIRDQDRIAQLVLCPVVQAEFEVVDSLATSERGQGGFGSTGVSV
jgi:dUTP pyrophosphatase